MFAFNFPALRRRGFLVVVCLCCNLASFAVSGNESQTVAIPGHVLPALDQAQAATLEKRANKAQPMLLTIVLKREDIKGFSSYMEAVYNPSSAIYLDFLTPLEVSERFGPSLANYDLVLEWFENQDFSIVETADNRMTLTVSHSREAVEKILNITINDFQLGERQFYANENEPRLPKELSSHVQSISGLSDLARPKPVFAIAFGSCVIEGFSGAINAGTSVNPFEACKTAVETCTKNKSIEFATSAIQTIACSIFAQVKSSLKAVAAWKDVDGAGQVIGITAFDTFNLEDISNYLDFFGVPRSQLNNLSQVHVNGGASPGANESEVLLDIDTVLLGAGGAQVVVYDAPLSGAGSFQALFNQMVNDGVTIISNSWAYCEDQTTLADVQSIDAILATASASGISVFNAAGDTGSTCLNGSPNTIAVPANSPNATAVGGTTLITTPATTLISETWWNGEADIPPTGQGGFGVSRFFSRPDYQNGFNMGPMRSIPDVVFDSDPAVGVVICQASDGGCPSSKLWGGTSVAAPAMAVGTALLNQALGQNIGNLNPIIYPLANSGSFRTPAMLNSDFEHVGLGSPRFNALFLAIDAAQPSAVSSEVSIVEAIYPAVEADGDANTLLAVRLRDASGNVISGKSVTLTANAGSSVVIIPNSGISDVDTGSVVFTLTNTAIEDVILTATVIPDGIELDLKAQVSFVTPVAVSASIIASPTVVQADGINSTTITVTLKDQLGRPTPGKLVTIEQNPGARSLISGSVPGTTDNNGVAVFTATNLHNETVTYSAVDVSDGFLPVPGSVDVNFFDSDGTACTGEPLSATPDYTIVPFAVSFAAADFFFGGINFSGCQGVIGMAFDNAGNLFAADVVTGDIYKFDVNGGTADDGTRISSALGPGVTGLAFGLDGKLYASRAGNPNTDVVEVDPVSGALVRVVGNVTLCAFGLATDPLSGDLFVSDFCFSGGSTAIHRIADPGGVAPVTTLYVNTPTDANGQIAIAPDGTLYLRSGANIVSVTGTDQPMPPIVNVLPLDNPIPFGNLGIAIGATALDGSALSLLANVAPDPDYGDNPLGMTAAFNLGESPLPVTAQLLNGQAESNVLGPDGCLYAAVHDTVYKVTNDDGSCGPLTARSAEPTLSLTPTLVNPNPVQTSELTMTARFFNISVPDNTPVFFNVEGVNALTKLGHTDANGIAMVTYQGTFSGDDVVTALAVIDENDVVSNPARITWQAGQHQSFLNFNTGPTSGTRGSLVTLQASLVDVSNDPQTAIAGQPIEFSVGGQSCSGNTDADGIASCSLILLQSGTFTLNAEFAGGGQFTGSASEQSFFVLDSPIVPPPPDNQVRQIPVFSIPGLILLNVIVGLLAVMGYRRRVR